MQVKKICEQWLWCWTSRRPSSGSVFLWFGPGRRTSQIETFVAEGNAKADEWAKEGAMLDGGFMAETRATTVRQEREEGNAALQYGASFRCLEGL